MSTILFYDPHRRHYSPVVDPDILHSQCLQCLYESLLTINNHIIQVICICSANTSTIIEEVQQRRQNTLIYLCEHCEPETNPTYSANVRDNIAFSSDSGWKFQIILARTKANRMNGCKNQAWNDLQKLQTMKQVSSSELRISVKVENHHQDISSNTSNEDAPGEETDQ